MHSQYLDISFSWVDGYYEFCFYRTNASTTAIHDKTTCETGLLNSHLKPCPQRRIPSSLFIYLVSNHEVTKFLGESISANNFS